MTDSSLCSEYFLVIRIFTIHFYRKLQLVMKKYLLVSFLSLLFVSCTSDSSRNNDLQISSIKANLEKAQALQASDYFEDVSYIPLETSDDFLLSYIGKMSIIGNNIYLMSNKSVYTFNLNTGKGALRLSKLGSGANEYKSLFDFIVDDSTGNIEILDNNAKKVIAYSPEGNYLYSLDLPFMPFSFFKHSADTYSFYNSNLESDYSSFKIVNYNVKNQAKNDEYFPIDKNMAEYFFLGDEKIFYKSSTGLYVHISPTDTIYEYRKNGEFVPSIHLDFLNHSAPASFYEKKFRDIMEFSEAATHNGYIYALSNFAVNKKDVIFSYRWEKSFYWTLRLGTNTERTVKEWKDDFHFTKPTALNYHNSAYWLDDDYFYFLITGEQFLGLHAKDIKKEWFSELVKNTEITEQSNPILVKCKLKRN